MSELEIMCAVKIEFAEAAFSVSVCKLSNRLASPPMGRRSNMTEASICAMGSGLAIQLLK